ncbi:hypothetical protein [Microvirga thermotolerans]|nr:hypothetical protein [Microvirga thermotolerans]
MDAYTLEGFLSAARWLGRKVLNEDAFLREEQERVFAWARTPPDPDGPVA